MINEQEFLDFVCVGAPRSGTTWVARALSEHPDVWIPRTKELNYFNEPYLSRIEYKYERGMDYYRSQFQNAPEGKQIGELTPTYYVDEKVAGILYNEFPNVKIIMMLRNPVDVIYSTYLKLKEYKEMEKSFEEALTNNKELLQLGFYYRKLMPYFNSFPHENIYIRQFEVFFNNQVEECVNLYNFIGVDDKFIPSILGKKVNERRVVYSENLVKMRHYFRRFINLKRMLPIKRILTKNDILDALSGKIIEWNLKSGVIPPVKKETREYLLDYFKDDTNKLAQLTSINTDLWK